MLAQKTETMQEKQYLQNSENLLTGWSEGGISLYHFNPTCEMAVANSYDSYVLPVHLKAFENDLSTLPCFFGRSCDYVLTSRKTERKFTDYLHRLGFETPAFITSADEFESSTTLNSLRPWGWSPAEHRKLQPFKQFLNTAPYHPLSQWKNEHALLLSRHTTLQLVTELNCVDKKIYTHLDIPAPPLQLTTLDEVKAVVEIIPPPVLLKTPWSASGRGLFRIRDMHEHAESNSWVKSKLRKQRFLLAEPFLKKVQDVSFHFYVDADSVRFLGTTFFETDAKGQFTGCYLRQPTALGLDSRFISEACQQAAQLLLAGLQQLQINHRYQGALGIDGIFFEKATGTILLNPCVEINLRHTMGLLNLFIRQHIHPYKNGWWTIEKFDAAFTSSYPLTDNCMADGYIAYGTVWLTPPSKYQNYAASLRIE